MGNRFMWLPIIIRCQSCSNVPIGQQQPLLTVIVISKLSAMKPGIRQAL